MQKPSIGWQSWSPPFPAWHGFPRWDYPPLKIRPLNLPLRESHIISPKIRYWCSWYAYGWNISHVKIVQTLEIIKQHKLPLTHILIDDGWTTWGDWHSPTEARFSSLADTIAVIKSDKLKAGLWFAPFLADKQSKLFKDHSDWFVKYRGKPVQGLKTMPIWEWFLPQKYLLDFELPVVRKYITDFIDLAVNIWQIDLLKLDFLYAPYFNPNYKSDDIPHDQIVWLLRYIKTNYPKITIIACGAPFTPTVGLADIIRISKDTALPPEFPIIINKLIYTFRVKILARKLSVPNPLKNISFDPDIRRFSLDNKSTIAIWDAIPPNIQGVGDNLTNLSLITLEKLKKWLSDESTHRTK